MINDNPKISVIMSVFNGEKYLKESIESVLNQTFRDFEFIIIDDGSDDETPEILKKYTKKDKRIKVIANSENIGLTKSLNKAVRASRGKYIARIDADDIVLPERFDRQVKFMDSNLEVGIVGSSYYLISEEGEIIDKKIPPLRDKELRRVIIRHNVFCHSSIMVRKEALERAGFYDENWRSAQDYELYFRIAKYFKLANLKESLVCWRVNKNSAFPRRDREQSKNALKAQIKAIREKQYPFYCYLCLIRPIISVISPCFIKKIVRRYILKRKY